MPDLKLMAFDTEDLAVLSAQLQDAILTVGEMTYQKRERRFAAVANRFDWADALKTVPRKKKAFERRRTGLRFDKVLGAQLAGINLKDHKQVLNVLAIRFEPKDEPEGYVIIECAGAAAIRLHVECIEAELKDLGAAWSTKKRPRHPGDGA
jgi:hypothetical protein